MINLEAQLIKDAKKRNPHAQAALYESYKRYWFAICLRYQSNRQDAEDCFQNSLVKIFTNISQFDMTKGAFKSWSSRIVVNENLIFLRSLPKTETLEFYNEELFSDSEESDSESSLSAEKLTKLIQQLPAGYRSVFNLYVLDGHTHEEISSILNISIGTSKSQLSKARKMLRHQMEVLI